MLAPLLLLSSIILACASNGSAGVTSSFIRHEWPSIDIPLDNEAFAVPKGYNAPQQVHITQGDYDGKAVIISWVTTEQPGSKKVQYGLSEGKYDFTAEGTVQNYTFYNYKSGYIHHCLVDGLEYNTKYYYLIGDGDSSRKFWFQTPPEINPDASYKFGIIGDLGQTYNSLSTLDHYEQTGAQTVLFVGDLSYADRYDKHDVGVRWDSWGRFVEKITAYQPWIWTVGNHEIEYFPHLQEVIPFRNYIHRYPTPHLASESSSPLWYAVRRGSAHIIVLSSYSPFVKYTPQYIWLQQELKKVDREKTPWLIVLMHAPIYNSNDAHYMEGESMRDVFESWFCEYKVDVIFAGHVHAYERSYRVSRLPDSSNPLPNKLAPVYITVGDGGNQEGLAKRFRDPQPDYSAFREASYGHSTLEIKNRTHAFYHWNRNDDGKRVQTDSFILHNQYWGSHHRRRKLKKKRVRAFSTDIKSHLRSSRINMRRPVESF
ncbi:bifunctional purple acid phosphatase 26 [Andrographis paniculata]|uniref:bifunctional purple acid phosphatase 26 n=1 Tax=Andrographis paniculata TaxID=175694 RepID=UPI0021E70637|nr:bifunctional purple acid phosphatase 26 [Andrographis paniculata]XP_051152604.1 bifunctional purple acid phosphatase 26 [Andrographis paniculata]XP_051152605.1 bifunctional purple acid phosphatase 26 [Andrographis paniculata]XP_051152606.1 bifunctional purple acid phosphatase 26 [Andrographis paniculata]XP_051152607.1 bifunctional purple acid phosphatase 26 [Andrographis paniculata]XP_051152608.1 bifunctional purple acid phosphatase 26 [Andrographis paniculata]